MRGYVGAIISAKKASVRIAAMDFIANSSDTPTKLKAKGAIDTESNLKAEVFDNILCAIGVAAGPYEARYRLMDESLLARRNRIAHGEFVDLDPDGWRNLAEEVIQLMRDFKNDIENAASTAAYLRPVVNA